MSPALLSAFLALAPVRAADAVKNPGTLVYLGISDPASLDPVWATDVQSELVLLNIYEPLVRLSGPAMRPEPLLSEKVPTVENGLLSADGKRYVFPIRRGVRFHHGGALSPEDVRYSLLRALLVEPAANAHALLRETVLGHESTRGADGKPRAGVWRDAARAIAVEGGSVIVTLPQPRPYFLKLLARLPILSREWAAEHGDWDGSEAAWPRFHDPKREDSPFHARADGTGPFRLERWDRARSEISLVRAEGYWRAPAALERVILRAIPEFMTRKLMLLAGDADIIMADLSFQSQLEGQPGLSLTKGLANIGLSNAIFFTFELNPEANPYIGSGRLDGEGIPLDFFAERDVRAAFAAAFDYERFIAEVLGETGTPGKGSVPRALPGHDPKGRSHRFDLKEAERLLRRARGGAIWRTGFKFAIATRTGNSMRLVAAQMLKRHIEGINPRFRIDIRVIDWPAMLAAANASKLPLFVMGASGIPDAQDFLVTMLHSKGRFAKRRGYANAEIDRLIDSAAAELDESRRHEIYRKVLALEFEDIPHVVLAESQDFHVQRDWVKGWVHEPAFPDASGPGYFYNLSKR